jgi:DNA (cytosine-5)-methyltransferase 1
LKYLSVCSGIEAATVAWHPLGWKAVAYSEIEKFPSEVLAHHYPNTPNVGDMTKFKEWNLESNVDLLVGGTPCQSFSVAGLRKGLDDPRGNLMLTYLAIADKFWPRWLVWENVPGVLSSNGGKDFGTFLGGLGELGYGFAYRILDAQYFGVAQRRRRVFVIGYLGDWRPAAAVLFERHSLSGNPAPSRQKGQEVAATIAARFGNSRNNHEECVTWPAEISSTLDTTFGTKQGLENQHVNAGCPMFVPSQPIALAENTIGRQPENGGNGDGFTDGGPMYTLNATGVHGVAQPIFFEPRSPDGVPRIHSVDGVSPTLNTMQGGNTQPCITHVINKPTIVHGTQDPCVSDIAFAQGRNNGGENVLIQPVGFDAYNNDITGEVSKTIDTGSDYHHVPNLWQGMAVRRLTPVECERLQGFGDNYTDIQSKGKPTPDGPRYKALGNSMAVPVMRWIGERIQKFEEMK